MGARCWWIPAALSALFAIVSFRQFGIAWDDPLQSQYGDRLISFYATGGADQSYLELNDLRYYGGAFEMPAQLLTRVSPFTPIETRRLFGGLVGALGVLGCGALGGLLVGPAGAWLSGGLLATWPTWVGHAFINSKDVPFAAAFVWAVYFLVRIARNGAVLRPLDHAFFSLSSGLAVGTRAGGLVLWLVYASLALVSLATTLRAPGDRVVLRAAHRVIAVVLTLAASCGLMMLAWPWTQEAPWSRSIEAMQLMTRFPRPMEVLFKGKLTVTTSLPWDYVPTWLGLTLPPLVVILLILTAPVALFHFREEKSRPGAAAAILLLLAGGPLAAAMAGRVVLYDGIRQLLFVVPILIPAAAWTGIEIARRLPSARWRGAAIALAALLSLDPLSGLVRLHPYQYIYFNRLAGGLSGAAGRFETDYWGLALRETAEWVNHNQGRLKSRGLLKVFVPHNCAEPTSAGHYLDPAIRLTDNNLAADYVLAPTRFKCDREFGGAPVYRVEREGVTLAVIKVME